MKTTILLAIAATLMTACSKHEPEVLTVRLSQFKAFPDDGIDDSRHVNRAIKFVHKNGGGEVVADKGVYNHSETIQLMSGVTLRGYEPKGTEFSFSGPFSRFKIVKPQPVVSNVVVRSIALARNLTP